MFILTPLSQLQQQWHSWFAVCSADCALPWGSHQLVKWVKRKVPGLFQSVYSAALEIGSTKKPHFQELLRQSKTCPLPHFYPLFHSRSLQHRYKISNIKDHHKTFNYRAISNVMFITTNKYGLTILDPSLHPFYTAYPGLGPGFRLISAHCTIIL